MKLQSAWILLLLVFSIHAETLKWIPAAGATLGKTIGNGDFATIAPLTGGAVAPNRVAKIYHRNRKELNPTKKSNMSERVLNDFYQAHERIYKVLGANTLQIDGVINWNNGNFGLVIEALPDDAERVDFKEFPARSKNANARTIVEFNRVMDKLREARLSHWDLHMAILKDGSIKIYDNDFITDYSHLTPTSEEFRSREDEWKVNREKGMQYLFLSTGINPLDILCPNPLNKIGRADINGKN